MINNRIDILWGIKDASFITTRGHYRKQENGRIIYKLSILIIQSWSSDREIGA